MTIPTRTPSADEPCDCECHLPASDMAPSECDGCTGTSEQERAEQKLATLRPLFAEYEEADMARRVGKGDKHADLSRFIDAERAIRATLSPVKEKE